MMFKTYSPMTTEITRNNSRIFCYSIYTNSRKLLAELNSIIQQNHN